MSDVMTMNGWSQQSTSFRFELLSQELVYLAELPVTGRVSVENNINRNIKRQLNGMTLPPGVISEIDVLSARVRAVMEFSDGTEYPLGIFLFTDASVTRANFAGNEFTDPGEAGVASMTMHDQLILLDVASSIPISFRPGTKITDALDALLTRVSTWSPGITWDIEPDDSALRANEWFVRPPGTSILAAMNDLTSMAGMYSVYADNDGMFTIKSVPSTDDIPTFIYGQDTTVYADSIVESTDLLNLPNRYIVINTMLTEQSIYGSYDIPANAQHSAANRGRLVTEIVDMQSISSNTQALAAARARARSDASSYQWVNFDAVPDPRHDTFDLVGWDGDVYREQSWNLVCAPGGVHHHELRRVYNPEEEDEVFGDDEVEE